MKQLLFIFFVLFPLLGQAQTFRLDTIPVAPNDPRNINRGQQTPQQIRSVDVDLQPINGNQSAVGQTNGAYQPVAVQAPQRQQSERLENLPPFHFDRSRLRLGVHAGFSSRGNHSSFALGPQVGYVFSDLFLFGAGFKYQHQRMNFNHIRTRNNYFGMNAFSFIYPTDFFTLFVQPEVNRLWQTVRLPDGFTVTDSGVVPVLLIGAGAHLNRFMHITLNYDLVRHRNSPYSDRIFLSISGFF